MSWPGERKRERGGKTLRRHSFLFETLSLSALTHEYSGAVLRLASSFEGLWSLGTASSRDGSRPPPNGEAESDARSSLLPLAATATNRSGGGQQRGGGAVLRRMLLLVAPAAPTATTIGDGADVEAPPHTRSKEVVEEDMPPFLASFAFLERSKPSARQRKKMPKMFHFFLSLRWRRRRKPRRRRKQQQQQQNQHQQNQQHRKTKE